MRRLFSGLLLATGVAVLAVGVLAAIELVLAKPRPKRRSSPPEQASEPHTEDAPLENRRFQIKRTKSEVGYVYWILEGFGKYKCYELCDSWEEAVDLARKKLAEAGEPVSAAAVV